MFAAARRRAFSLIELVIVVVIIGIIGAIAIPRMSRGAEGASDSAVKANLAVLRNAIDLYKTEQGSYPTIAKFVDQLTTYTDGAGNAQATKDTTFVYGPYLRAVPTLPVGPQKGLTKIAGAAAADVGWVYNETTGIIVPNTGTLTDVKGIKYTDY